MKIEEKKKLLARLLDAERGSRVRLARFCGVTRDMPTVWTRQGASWPGVEREELICEYFGIDPKTFYRDATAPVLDRYGKLYSDLSSDSSSEKKVFLKSDVSPKRQQLAQRLNEKGRGARAELARFCGVSPRM